MGAVQGTFRCSFQEASILSSFKGAKNGCGECNYPLGNLKLLRIFMGAKADLNFVKKQ